MINIIAGTNRPNSATLAISIYYKTVLEELTQETIHLTRLQDLPPQVLDPGLFLDSDTAHPLAQYQDNVFIPAKKIIIIAPEYNGGFPGVLKLFLDSLSLRKYGETFSGKKAALVGISSGRAGNLRGMDHLTGILNYLKVHVHPNKLPISQINNIVKDGKLVDPETQSAIRKQLIEFLKY